MQCLVETVFLLGPHAEIIGHRLQTLKTLMTYHPQLVPHIVSSLLLSGFDGLRAIIEMAERDHNGCQQVILSVLI